VNVFSGVQNKIGAALAGVEYGVAAGKARIGSHSGDSALCFGDRILPVRGELVAIGLNVRQHDRAHQGQNFGDMVVRADRMEVVDVRGA